jgi:hypothetical protein
MQGSIRHVAQYLQNYLPENEIDADSEEEDEEVEDAGSKD